MARIFLCHASDDKAHVREVYHRLWAIEGFEPWLDEEDLLPGQEWVREIPRALQTSDFILIFLSRTSVAKRGYVQHEMKMALDAWREMPEGTIHTIPIRLDEHGDVEGGDCIIDGYNPTKAQKRPTKGVLKTREYQQELTHERAGK